MSNNFKAISRINNFSFPSAKGNLSVAQVWNLPTEFSKDYVRRPNDLCILDLLMQYDAEIQSSAVSSNLDFLKKIERVAVDPTTQLRFDVVKEIYMDKIKEQDKARYETMLKQDAQRIAELIEERKTKDAKKLSMAELEAKEKEIQKQLKSL